MCSFISKHFRNCFATLVFQTVNQTLFIVS